VPGYQPPNIPEQYIVVPERPAPTGDIPVVAPAAEAVRS
jgi:hypothetical protein